ncbi:hypothetical protein [Indioceanicola profundi]|uniref:hypothetical protein n=1 Tax=Indioceanicola profundi TaxID=2220096 RepID=UPI0013C40584|nr:hypothetical protein [Indioceanicola profundi]
MGRNSRTAADPKKAVRMAQVGVELAETSMVFAEMATAAQQTITYRLVRMAGIMADPKTMHDPEFRRMGQEKLVAASQAVFALGEGWREVLDGVWSWAGIQATAWEQLAMTVATARDPGALIEAQSRFLDRSLTAAEEASAHMAVGVSRLAGLGLAPIHKATRANARRLSREARLPALLG